MAESEGVRLQKVLSQAGIASRRVAEKMIVGGRVEVDGRVVTELGTRVNPDVSVIRVDGTRVMVDDTLVHLALNKPRGMHSTMSDDRGRPCIGDLVEHRVRGNKKLFHVGRLDADTEGLMLLTNDGELAHRLMHPSFEVPKTYLATVAGSVPRGLGRKLRAGIELDDGPARVDDFAVVDAVPGKTMVRVTLHEGRKRIVRRLLAAVGFPVQELVRTDIGAVSLGDQRPGSIRVLGRNEIGERTRRWAREWLTGDRGRRPGGDRKVLGIKRFGTHPGCALPGHRGDVPDRDTGSAASRC
jgi:23S rRNA pseudouridine2605 synthase